MRILLSSSLCLAMMLALLGCNNKGIEAPDKDKLKTLETKAVTVGARKGMEVK